MRKMIRRKASGTALTVKTLREMKAGEEGVVEKVTAEGGLRRRIFDMGLTPGAAVTLKKAAPFGDPLECCVRGYSLLIRKSEAEHIQIVNQEKTK